MSDLSYLKSMDQFADWMAQMGYEGQVWKDRTVKPVDTSEHPQRGVSLESAISVLEYVNLIASKTPALNLITGRAYLWVNYGTAEIHRYAPVEAFPSESWVGGQYEFYIFMASPQDDSLNATPARPGGPTLNQVRAILNWRNVTDVLNLFTPHGDMSGGLLSYTPAAEAAKQAYSEAWNRVID